MSMSRLIPAIGSRSTWRFLLANSTKNIVTNHGDNMKNYKLDNKILTDEQKEMLAKMEQAPINFDDIPELTEEQLAQFYRVREKDDKTTSKK